MIKIEVIDFNLDDSITSGQFFRFEKELDNSYTIILNDRVINIKQLDNTLYINSNMESNLESVVNEFFDLNTDYNVLNKKILELDNSLSYIIDSCKGFKVLKMDPFETIISYIISANNNVSNIRKSVNLLSNKYGEKVIYNNKEYYLFPSYYSLKSITLEELNEMKLGFRSRYVLEIINKINNSELDLNSINNMTTAESLEHLIGYKGIGLKVASCILLFAYKRYDVFPIDTWVKKAMKELYGVDDIKSMKRISQEKHGIYSGMVIQYLFHSKRNK